MPYCEFEQYDDYHVKCTFCGKRLSGTPERYAETYACGKQGIGTDFADKLFSWSKVLMLSVKKCPKCKTLETEMNKEGLEWVKQKHDWIVEQVLKNAKDQGVSILGMGFGVSNVLKSVEKQYGT